MTPDRGDLLADLAARMTRAGDSIPGVWTGFSVVAEIAALGVRVTGFRYDGDGARPADPDGHRRHRGHRRSAHREPGPGRASCSTSTSPAWGSAQRWHRRPGVHHAERIRLPGDGAQRDGRGRAGASRPGVPPGDRARAGFGRAPATAGQAVGAVAAVEPEPAGSAPPAEPPAQPDQPRPADEPPAPTEEPAPPRTTGPRSRTTSPRPTSTSLCRTTNSPRPTSRPCHRGRRRNRARQRSRIRRPRS